MEEKSKELKQAKRNYIVLLIVGILAIIIGFNLFSQLTSLEQGSGGTISLPRFIYTIYKGFGKWGVLAISEILGISCIFYGRSVYSKAKKEHAENQL